ncbi:hypothetical protein ACO03V_15925 [Microbacterium sp. HMH0099]|uniref:hypothetical protein n=1 Tax=Microbacterium TaxID=33882 RepID=UPI0036DF9FE3
MDRIAPETPHLPVAIEPGITLAELIERVQAARGKPLSIHELPGLTHEDNALCGLWLAADDRDIILHAASESALHREQFILHELAHMLLLHDRVDGAGYVTGAVLPGYEDATVIKALARDALNDDVEIAAERLADILATSLRRKRPTPFSEVFG